MKKIFILSLIFIAILTSSSSCHKQKYHSVFGTVENVFMTENSGSLILKGNTRVYEVFGTGVNDDVQKLHAVFHMIKPGDRVTLTYDSFRRVHGVINNTTNQSEGENLNEIK